MSLALPDILRDERYKGMWRFDDHGWPTALPEAPEELKEELDRFRTENQGGYDEETDSFIYV